MNPELFPCSTASALILGAIGTLVVQCAWRAFLRSHRRRLSRRINARESTQRYIHKA